MKNLFFLLFLLCFVVIGANGQENRQERNARVEALRVAYITENLKLTVEESQMFWPIFNEYEAKRKKIQKNFDRRRDVKLMTNAEAEDFIIQSFDKDQQILDLKKIYFEKFKTAIPIKKIAELPRIEKRFRQELLKKMRERQGRPSRRGGSK